MREDTTIGALAGGTALREWFGVEPSFHDAILLSLELRQGGASCLKARTFRIGPEIDTEGFFVLNKRVDVTFKLIGLPEAEIYEIVGQAIIDGLSIHLHDDGVELSWDASYGAHGRVKASEVSISFDPVVSSGSE